MSAMRRVRSPGLASTLFKAVRGTGSAVAPIARICPRAVPENDDTRGER
jgi:hypothetical protein